MVAVKTFLCFFLSTAVLIGTAVGNYVDTSEELNPQESSFEREEICPLGERWDSCASCQKTCTSINENPGACSDDCRAGCVCDKEYVRGPHGQCIKAKECSGGNFCPKNEEFVPCKGLCELDCSSRNKTVRPDCGTFWCTSSCRCSPGYVRGPKGTCIKPDECPNDDNTKYPVRRVCPENEIWKGDASCQWNCTHPRPSVCPLNTVNGCICRDGYKRRPDGKCVPENECPKKDELHEEESSTEESQEDSFGRSFCPRNEKFIACKGLCELDCSRKNETRLGCDGWCVSSCICVSGYVRGPNGTCIKSDKCPADDDTEYPVKRVCAKNEVWSGFAHCQTNCTHPRSRLCPRIAIEGCVCKKGYKRRPDGKCVPKNKCPKKNNVFPFNFCATNEVYSLCPSSCPDNCTNYEDRNRMCNKLCLTLPGCICKPSYVKGPDGSCIKYDQCPHKKRPEDCTENEFYNPCGSLCEDNCDNYRDKDRTCDKQCIPGCFCKGGMIRGPKNDCIFPFDCSEQSSVVKDKNNGIDAEVTEAEIHGKEDNNQYDRRKEENIETEDIGTDGAALFQFPIFCKTNEVRSLCSCPVDCTNYKTKKCMLCIPGCECKKGYVYGPDGTCIPIKECHKEKKPDDCTDLEYYDICGTNCENDCKNYNSPDKICDRSCKIGCFCQPGLVRGPKGDCIWPFHCNISSAKGDELVSDVSDDDHGCPRDPYQCQQYCIDNGYVDGACSDSTCFCQQRGHECDNDSDCIQICQSSHGYCDQEHHCVC